MSELSVNFTVTDVTTDFNLEQGPNITLGVQEPLSASLYIEGTAPFLNGVTKIIASDGVIISPVDGTGNVTIGVDIANVGAVRSIIAGDGITISPIDGKGNVTINVDSSDSVRSIIAGTNITIDPIDGKGNVTINCTAPGTGTVTSVNGTGSGLGFSLSGTVTTSGNITLATPDSTSLRTTLNIGNVANLNLDNNTGNVLYGNGVFSALPAQPPVDYIADLKYAIENITIMSHATGTYNFDVLTSAIHYSTTNATGNISINIRGNSTTTLNSTLAVGKSLTVVYIMSTGTTGYTPTVINIDGVAQTILYEGGLPPLTNYTSSKVSYTYTIIKTASTPSYTVLGSQTRYV